MPPEHLAQVATELIESLPWSIVLPAGCGKTELVAAMASVVSPESKPILVLTHTNAGVDVLRKRFAKYHIDSGRVRVQTLDTWALYFKDHFPILGDPAGVDRHTEDWSEIRLRALKVLASNHIGDVVAASYSAVLVDEYQDCSITQHEIIKAMSNYIPVGVLGDPLQGIFDFGEGIVDWTNVESSFPPKPLDITPHRWTRRNPELGQWLLGIRPLLIAGGTLDLRPAGGFIQWRQSTPDLSAELGETYQVNRDANEDEHVVFLLQQANQCHSFARRTGGLLSVSEEIQCRVLEPLLTAIDSSDGAKAAAETIRLIKQCYTGCPSVFDNTLLQQYAAGNARTYRADNSFAIEYDALNLVLSNPNAQNVHHALSLITGKCNQLFRREAWYAAMEVFRELTYNDTSTAMQLLRDIRGRSRYGARFISKRSVSRTLLVKGQEYDRCIIIGADGMSARNLYVALSRGIENVTIFSQQPVMTITSF